MLMLLYLVLIFTSSTEAANILVYAPSYSNSHLIANARLADTLANAGHRVVMFTPEYESTKFQRDGKFEFIKMPSLSQSYDDLVANWSGFDQYTLGVFERRGWEDVLAYMCEAILLRRSELEHLRSYNFTVGFTEQIDFCGVGIIHYLGIPNHIWISSCPMMESVSYNLGVPTPLSYVPVIEESNLNVEMSFLERLHNFYLWTVSIYLNRYGTDLVTDKFRRVVDQNFPHVRQLARESALCFIHSDEFLDVTRPILHKTIYIGGIGMSHETKPLKEPFLSMMKKGEKGIVLISFGTLAHTQTIPEAVLNDLIRVFSRFTQYHFIMKVDKLDGKFAGMVRSLPNVDLAEWIPQVDILGHPRLKCFVMHGGFYGIEEATIHAVPMVIVPFFADQFRNARAAEHLGIAVTVQKNEMNYDRMEYALNEILTDPKYTKAVQRLSRMIRKKPNKPEEQLIKWTEFVIEFGSLPELRAYGDRLNTIVYFGIDIIIFLLCSIFAILFVAYFVMKYLLLLHCRQTLQDSPKKTQ